MDKTQTPTNLNDTLPPTSGAQIVRLPLEDLFRNLNLPALFRIGWGAGKASGEKWQRYQDTFAARLSAMQQSLTQESWLTPKAAYGCWPCTGTPDSLLVYPHGVGQTPITLPVPRQPQPPHRSLADYVKPIGSDKPDWIGFQLVTMGSSAVEYVKRLRKSGDEVEAYYAHGLATQLTEAAAKVIFSNIREQLGLPQGHGKRYSWGYEVLPDLSQQVQVVQLLDPQYQLGITFTSAYQFIPEFTTAALALFHPDAQYFRITDKG